MDVRAASDTDTTANEVFCYSSSFLQKTYNNANVEAHHTHQGRAGQTIEAG